MLGSPASAQSTAADLLCKDAASPCSVTSSHHLSSSLLISRLAPRLSRFPPFTHPVQNALPILVHLQLGNHALAGVDADRHALAVGFLTRHPLHVHHVFQAVDRDDFAFAPFVGAAGDDDLVVFSDGDASDLEGERRDWLAGCLWEALRGLLMGGAYIVFLAEFFAKGRTHDVSPNA